MIEKGTTLFPTTQDCSQLWYNDEPYAYWEEFSGEWILYKEYNDYCSICHPNDCISAVSYEEMLDHFRTYFWFEDYDREKLCRTFRQRSLDDNPYGDFDDYVEEN